MVYGAGCIKAADLAEESLSQAASPLSRMALYTKAATGSGRQALTTRLGPCLQSEEETGRLRKWQVVSAVPQSAWRVCFVLFIFYLFFIV